MVPVALQGPGEPLADFALADTGADSTALPLSHAAELGISLQDDLVRLRSQVGRDLALSALRRYLQSGDAKPGELLALTRRLRVGTVMAEAMEPLLA